MVYQFESLTLFLLPLLIHSYLLFYIFFYFYFCFWIKIYLRFLNHDALFFYHAKLLSLRSFESHNSILFLLRIHHYFFSFDVSLFVNRHHRRIPLRYLRFGHCRPKRPRDSLLHWGGTLMLKCALR